MKLDDDESEDDNNVGDIGDTLTLSKVASTAFVELSVPISLKN